jgi:hypothetical protein
MYSELWAMSSTTTVFDEDKKVLFDVHGHVCNLDITFKLTSPWCSRFRCRGRELNKEQF